MTNDLINRDDFINYIVCLVSSPCETKQEQRDAQFKQKYTVDAFIKELKRAPAVDAVEVVRCKDCQYYPQIDCFGDACCNMFLRHSTVLVPRKSTDYCSYGKRRESEVSE